DLATFDLALAGLVCLTFFVACCAAACWFGFFATVAQGPCSTGDPIAGLLSRGRERDLSGSQAIHPMPLPRSRTPAESTIPRLLTVSSMLPLLPSQQRLQRNGNFGATARLQHLLPTLQEWCCHHPCKARFRLAGSPLPGGS